MPDSIKQWQQALLGHGYDLGPAGADGDFGPATLRASLKVLNGEVGGNGRHSLTAPDAFFTELRKAFGSLNKTQVDGANTLLKAMERWPVSWAAYGLATAWHETARTLQPIKEHGGPVYFHRMYDKDGERPTVAQRLGNTRPGDGVKYAGRGYVQITGRANYEKYGIAGDPDRALRPDCAAHILVDGMEKGVFTGRKLADYLPGDFVNARKIINGLDKAETVALYAKAFEAALTAGGW